MKIKIKLQKKPLYDTLSGLIRLLIKKDDYQLFIEDVDTTLVQDYLTVIKTPMSFNQMQRKLDARQYNNFEEFINDFHLICDNAMVYNAPKTIYHKQAKKLKAYGDLTLGRHKGKCMTKQEEDDLKQKKLNAQQQRQSSSHSLSQKQQQQQQQLQQSQQSSLTDRRSISVIGGDDQSRSGSIQQDQSQFDRPKRNKKRVNYEIQPKVYTHLDDGSMIINNDQDYYRLALCGTSYPYKHSKSPYRTTSAQDDSQLSKAPNEADNVDELSYNSSYFNFGPYNALNLVDNQSNQVGSHSREFPQEYRDQLNDLISVIYGDLQAFAYCRSLREFNIGIGTFKATQKWLDQLTHGFDTFISNLLNGTPQPELQICQLIEIRQQLMQAEMVLRQAPYEIQSTRLDFLRSAAHTVQENNDSSQEDSSQEVDPDIMQDYSCQDGSSINDILCKNAVLLRELVDQMSPEDVAQDMVSQEDADTAINMGKAAKTIAHNIGILYATTQKSQSPAQSPQIQE
ncbi:hypothetical protein MP228_010142 [Amoeboaphelidium protococcarum]|nr:hypothetical protein MP228_010142 [Amoeboaphelidium protococcarum]